MKKKKIIPAAGNLNFIEEAFLFSFKFASVQAIQSLYTVTCPLNKSWKFAFIADLTSLLTVLQAFSKSAQAQAASVGELCDETTVKGHYTLCKAELDANIDVCGTQCQDALQVSSIHQLWASTSFSRLSRRFFNLVFSFSCFQYVADSCQYLIPEVTMDPETCYVNDTRAAGAPSSATSFGAAATVVAATVIMAAYIMI